MIEVEDWAEIRRLHRAEGLPIKQIARIKNVSRNTVRAALRSDGPPKYERAAKGSVADGFEPRIRELLMAYPMMPASVIGERIGWPYSDRTLRTRVAELRPAYLPPDPASRTSYAAGELEDRSSAMEGRLPPCCAGRQLPQLPTDGGPQRGSI